MFKLSMERLAISSCDWYMRASVTVEISRDINLTVFNFILRKYRSGNRVDAVAGGHALPKEQKRQKKKKKTEATTTKNKRTFNRYLYIT